MSKNTTPKLFEIHKSVSDSEHLLSAFAEALQSIGYDVENIGAEYAEDVIHFNTEYNTTRLASLGDFKKLDINDDQKKVTSKTKPVIFTIPKDWDKALKFAKEQLEIDYWSTRKVYKLNGYTFEIDKETKTWKCDRFEGTFEEVIYLYNIQVEYQSKFGDFSTNKEVELCIKAGCQTIELADLKEIVEAMKRSI